MNLHQDKSLFQDAVLATAQQLKIPEIYIEKDYWVTYALYQLFTGEIGNEVVFKGGTALSKCFGLIQRFSEDIDLIVFKNESDSANQLKTKLKSISSAIAKDLPEIEIKGITNKKGMIRKTAHAYPHLFSGTYGQVRDSIIIESSWLGYFEPFSKAKVSCFIAEMMQKNKQNDLIERYILSPFEVQVLNPERTLCEKIMSLVRFSYSSNPILDLRNKIRHTYDIHLMLKDDKINSFFESMHFEEMLQWVKNDDLQSFKNNTTWLANHPASAIIFSNTSETWNQMKTVYKNSFAELVFGNLPDESDIEKTLFEIAMRVKRCKWDK